MKFLANILVPNTASVGFLVSIVLLCREGSIQSSETFIASKLFALLRIGDMFERNYSFVILHLWKL